MGCGNIVCGSLLETHKRETKSHMNPSSHSMHHPSLSLKYLDIMQSYPSIFEHFSMSTFPFSFSHTHCLHAFLHIKQWLSHCILLSFGEDGGHCENSIHLLLSKIGWDKGHRHDFYFFCMFFFVFSFLGSCMDGRTFVNWATSYGESFGVVTCGANDLTAIGPFHSVFTRLGRGSSSLTIPK